MSLLKQFERLPTETKLISVIDTESQIDEKTFFNISVNSLLFKLTAGRQRITSKLWVMLESNMFI